MSTPRSFQGSFVGSRSAVTLIAPFPTLIVSPFDGYFAGEAAVHAVIAQQVCVRFNRSEVVNGNDFNIFATGFSNGAQDIAADAAKSVNANTDCHELLPA